MTSDRSRYPRYPCDRSVTWQQGLTVPVAPVVPVTGLAWQRLTVPITPVVPVTGLPPGNNV